MNEKTTMIDIQNSDDDILTDTEPGETECTCICDTAAAPPKRHGGVFAARIVSLVLCALTVGAYIPLCIDLFDYLKGGGAFRIVAGSVFGGSEPVKISPLPSTDEDENPPVITESANTVDENLAAADVFEVFNETAYGIVPEDIIAAETPFVFGDGDAVLVVHTHTTECYNGTPNADNFRSSDAAYNMVAVGEAFCKALEEKSVKCYHSTKYFDDVSFSDAYEKSSAEVSAQLKAHPEISVVFDIHRDSVVHEDGAVVRTNGGDGAQLMLVLGTDEGGADFPAWRDNLAFAFRYQKASIEDNPAIARHIDLRSVSFNEQLAKRYILMEVGSSGNTLDEAKKCACKAADTLAGILKGK